jgi:hypothetical protein
MNYHRWRNDEAVRERLKALAVSLGTNPVAAQMIESLLLSAWIDGTQQGAARECEAAITGGVMKTYDCWVTRTKTIHLGSVEAESADDAEIWAKDQLWSVDEGEYETITEFEVQEVEP